ncbi:uncharacterized protein LOC118743637 [Rhagoletis pomonella]|uniref:uncharacterized protein LOC118743637 n=1 Tax=Rhagoletis pomonella TaxID=28610 RepID=UPI001780A7A7|nr:uncharacterized protein LOC118743637 [Rhagoletis pomonella]
MVEEAQDNGEQALASDLDQPSTSNTSGSKRRLAKKNKKKPIAILAYNKGKAGIDLSDQNCSYATTLRKGVKWYRKLGIEHLLGLSVVNAFVVYKKATKKNNAQIRWFREQITSSLLNLQKPEKHMKPKSGNIHILKIKLSASNTKLRRTCTLCYSRIKQMEGREFARKKAKRVYTYCPDCPQEPFMCLECFGNHHKQV